MHRLRHSLILAVILAAFAVFLIWPIVQVVRVGFFGIPGEPDSGTFTLSFIVAIFQDHSLRQGLINSALIAVSVTLVCMLIGGLLLVPLILPPFVGAIGMRQILGRFGVLTSAAQGMGLVDPSSPVDWIGSARMFGIILVESLALYPILFLNVSAALANLDPAMEQAAANLGATRWTIFRKITLPLMRPGLFAGGTIVLIWSFTELGTPLMFDFYEATPVQIFRRITQVSGSPVPYALVVVMLFASVLLYITGRVILGRRQDAAVTKASVQSATRNLGPVASIPVLLPFLVVSGLALLPHVGVILMSVSGVGAWYNSALPRVFTDDHYVTGLTRSLTLPSVQNSLKFASASMVIDIALGVLIAVIVVRSKLPVALRQFVDSLSMLPLAVPGLVLAFGYLAISLRLQTWVAAWDANTARDLTWLRQLVDVNENPTLLLVVAYAMRRLPYVVRSAVAGLEQTPVDLELAAHNP